MAKAIVSRFTDLEDAKCHYIRRIDELAEQSRATIITAAPGQAITYDAKLQEAQRYPNDGPFPWLEGEAEALGTTPRAVAESVLSARAAWESAGISIEQARLKAKAQVRAASTAADMHAALERLRAATPEAPAATEAVFHSWR